MTLSDDLEHCHKVLKTRFYCVAQCVIHVDGYLERENSFLKNTTLMTTNCA